MRGEYKFLLLLGVLLLILAGCGKSENNSNPDTTAAAPPIPVITGGDSQNGGAAVPARDEMPADYVTLRILSHWDDASQAVDDIPNDSLALQVMDKLRLNIELMPCPDDYAGSMDVLAASDDLPDLFPITLEPAQLHGLINNGSIRAVSESQLNDYPLLLDILRSDERINAYKTLYNGACWFIPRVNDRDPMYGTDNMRIFYRKDWAEALHIDTPVTTDDFYEMAVAFSQMTPESSSGAALAVGGAYADVFAGFFGITPGSWVYEKGRYVPGYYTDAMIAPLQYARCMWEEGLLVFENGTLNDYGIIIADGDDAQAMYEDTASPFAEAYEQYIGVSDIPHAPDMASVWLYNYRPDGWVFNTAASDEVVDGALSLFDYSLTDEACKYTRYGIPGVTYTQNTNGVFLFTDPATNRAYDLSILYPTGGFLGLVTLDYARVADVYLPTVLPQAIRSSWAETTFRYYRPYESETAALCNIVPSPARNALRIDYNEFFMYIVTNDDPVEEAFERFREECRNRGVEEASAEVTDAVSAVILP